MKKKLYVLFLILASFAFTAINANAQQVEFPWPDLGEAMVITPGAPGVINETINNDKDGAGNRLHKSYILKRGATYLYTAQIQNSGWPLMVVAEPGDGPLPIIKALGPLPGQNEANRIFHAEGDLYIKDLALSGWDQGGNFTDNATVRVAADGITVVLKGIAFDFNRQNNFRINAKNSKIYIEDCIIANQGYGGRYDQGFFFNTRGNYFPIAHVRNNTIYNMQNSVIEHQGQTPRTYQKLIFESNTIVNTGASGMRFGRPDSVIFKNNLIVNMGILGDATQGDRDRFVEPLYFVDIDSVYTDTTNTILKKPYIDWRSNYFYFDPEVAALLPDSANASHKSLIHPYLRNLIGENNIKLMDEKFTFANFPASIAEYKQHIDDFYNRTDERANLPQFDTPWNELDFTYSESHPAYSAATDGGPIGDRNWFPNYISTGVISKKFNEISIYPNPVTNKLYINLGKTINVDRIALYDITGKIIKSINNIERNEVSMDVNNVLPGMYLIKLFDGNTSVGARKIIKK